MCAICQQLDRKIARYREFIEKVPDTQLAEGLAKLIEEAETEKAAVHRKQQK
jgi:hypothetical protein